MRKNPVGTERQIENTLDVLARFSEESEGDGQLRDAIGLVRHELDEYLESHL